VLALRAERAFDGERLLERVMVLLDGDQVHSVDTSGADAPAGAEVLEFGDATILPGLVDAHIHLAFDAGPDPLGRLAEVGDGQLVQEMLRAAQLALLAGVTTVRDVGDRGFLGVRVRDLIAADPLMGADVVPAGPPLTTPRGHCWLLGGIVQDESAIRAVVRDHAARGVGVIKVMVTGGEMTPGTDPRACQFSLAALRAAADEAHTQGLPITGHAHGTAGIEAAVKAGFDGVEHASFSEHAGPRADPAVVAELAASGVVVTVLAGHRPGVVVPPEIVAFIEQSQRVRRQMFDAGVTVIPGPDGGIGPNKPHDVLPHSVIKLAEIMPHIDVLTAVTKVAAQACDLGHRKGRLLPGYDADALVVAGDPVSDISRVSAPLAVFHRGHRVR
jgi:imidazolonepropionase-like amidohydrolase